LLRAQKAADGPVRDSTLLAAALIAMPLLLWTRAGRGSNAVACHRRIAVVRELAGAALGVSGVWGLVIGVTGFGAIGVACGIVSALLGVAYRKAHPAVPS
jgi:hypothetical protein